MGKKGGSAPAAPDPKVTAAAQTGTNVSTALANAALNNVSQVTPDGSLNYSTNGYEAFTDPTSGATYQIPKYVSTQTLSAPQQAIKDQNDAASLNLGTIANNQSKFLEDYLSKPVTLGNEATEARLMELGRSRLDPALADRRAALQTQLTNQGVRLGSTAYDTAMNQADQGENDAYNQLLLTGRQQAVQEQLTERNQPLNEISALMSGSQVSSPNFVPTNQPTIPTVDYAGLVQQNYQSQMAAWQAKQAQSQSTLGGLFGLGANLIAASDRRLKTDIRRVGRGPLGLPIYAFRYIWGGPMHLGFMAQEVAKILPEAVVRMANGFLAVDYGKVLRMEAV